MIDKGYEYVGIRSPIGQVWVESVEDYPGMYELRVERVAGLGVGGGRGFEAY